MSKKRKVRSTIMARLREFTRSLEAGIPIEATKIVRVRRMTLEEWRAACPLQKWIERRGHGAITQLAKELGVHRATIDLWTRGIQPRLHHLQKLEAETGIKVSSWMRWLTKKPPEAPDGE